MKFDFIPLELYTLFFYYVTLLVVIVYYFKLQEGFRKTNFGFLFVVGIIIYMGFRPVSGSYFGDMSTYNRIFLQYQQGLPIQSKTDLLFHVFTKWCSGIMTADFYFLLCAFIYVFPLYLVSRKWFGDYWFYSFLLLATSFSFWSAGVNGIRAAIAGSILLLAFSRDKRYLQVFLIVLSVSIHKTMLLPAVGFLIAHFYNKPKQMIVFWILCIPLSLIGGGFWEVFFAGLGFEDDRLSYLTDGGDIKENFSSIGFRWDFLAYSSTAVFAGYYFIIKKKFNDRIYFLLFNTYVFANAFWILVIRANFSNRFAYLSWFMMAIIIIYPMLKVNMLQSQSKKFAIILLVYFLFTYTLNVLLLK